MTGWKTVVFVFQDCAGPHVHIRQRRERVQYNSCLSFVPWYLPTKLLIARLPRLLVCSPFLIPLRKFETQL